MTKRYTLTEKLWLYPGKAAWCFITISPALTEEIDYFFSHQKRGWGSLRVSVTVGATSWKTSIFPDKKTRTYLLPIKAAVRTAEKLQIGEMVLVSLELQG